jgi:SAM-dependent methyltransferase
LDLGCGTGANLRHLAPILAVDHHWTCLDLDPDLLRVLPRRTAAWATGLGMEPQPAGEGGLRIQGAGSTWEVRTQAFDLSRGIGALPLGPGTLVVASALLDLVSEGWLTELLRTCAGARAPLLLTLTYDGRMTLDPALPLDGTVIGLVNAHQGRDKGFGSALGPSAGARLAQLGDTLGFSMGFAQSDWRLDSDETDLQVALTHGWTAAALEQAAATRGPNDLALTTSIHEWQQVRYAEIVAKGSRLRVGHQDALLLPR